MECKERLKEYLKRRQDIMRTTFLDWCSLIIFVFSFSILGSKLSMIMDSSFTNGDIIGLVLSLMFVILTISYIIFDLVKTKKNIKNLNNEFGLGDEDGL
ncbi:hypothetical protein [Spiroplasma endosymbiont of Apeira syringaria]|uniref:hypothetical protein n=1 Tax=Spiroplasma endosymbiont of Apeira syringaria TaxID=3066307 RepID=UPI0030D211B8